MDIHTGVPYDGSEVGEGATVGDGAAVGLGTADAEGARALGGDGLVIPTAVAVDGGSVGEAGARVASPPTGEVATASRVAGSVSRGPGGCCRWCCHSAQLA
jgi:hypothetical protein